MNKQSDNLHIKDTSNLAGDFEFPHHVPPLVLGLAIDAIVKSYRNVCDNHETTIISFNEKRLSLYLFREIAKLIKSSRLLKLFFVAATKESGTENHDDTRIDDNTDIGLLLQDWLSYHYLVIEAKIINKAKSQTVSKYIDEGIMRFVKGNYSHYHDAAIMVAYVRDSSKLDPDLYSKLNYDNSELIEKGTVCQIEAGAELSTTVHGRSENIDGDTSLGPITIWNLWMDEAHNLQMVQGNG